MNINSIYLSYHVNDVLKEITLNFLESVENDDIKFVPLASEFENGYILEVKVISKKKIILDDFTIEYSINIKNSNMLVNGYQSWTESMEMTKNDELKSLNPIINGIMEPHGDYSFYKYKGQKGVLHSYAFTYFRDIKKQVNDVLFLGSLDEKSGYTIFEGNLKNDKLIIKKDCSGYLIDGEKSILKIYIEKSEENKAWDKYSSLFEENRKKCDTCVGWTSWYNYYTDITQDIILENLENMVRERIPLDVFQIDDGYQNALGDWLLTNEKFPLGMNFLAYKIKSFGYRPGIWIAPFICSKDSEIFEKHKNWILKDNKGKYVVGGWNSKWGGKFYTLDFYNIEVREYLAKVFHTVINIWGYEVLKLDFLYAVAIIPRNGKTRGAIMQDALDFLSDIIGNKWIIGSGVPIGSAFNKVDYCRVGADTSIYWENNKQKFLKYRERVSSISSIHSAIARCKLNNRVFNNNPDAFILRKENNKLNDEQKYTLFVLNNVLGNCLFFSDNVKDYDKNTMELLKSIFPKVKIKINYIKNKKEVYEFYVSANDREYIILSNLSNSQAKVKIPEGEYFNKTEFVIKGNSTMKLKPYETKCYYKIKQKKDFYLIGTTGHLFSGSEIELLELTEEGINIKIKDKFINKSDVYIKVLKDNVNIFVDGKKCTKVNKKGYTIIRI
ncbi:alpha-galactosidase [Clostridium sp. MB40-C1]|uniref:glycoside hydrolase family 36 protein n=1 Tax=Clostridium sp. MB40-C1 TaxID=3070996 RepID=UPI0027E0717D|nr:glycoside hydrolase family 36 protein [Clostridium sp. MB40-C1]WMJ80434.1 alpha-galactosidase [Clostridium sp. MB40-C1]